MMMERGKAAKEWKKICQKREKEKSLFLIHKAKA